MLVVLALCMCTIVCVCVCVCIAVVLHSPVLGVCMLSYCLFCTSSSDVCFCNQLCM